MGDEYDASPIPIPQSTFDRIVFPYNIDKKILEINNYSPFLTGDRISLSEVREALREIELMLLKHPDLRDFLFCCHGVIIFLLAAFAFFMGFFLFSRLLKVVSSDLIFLVYLGIIITSLLPVLWFFGYCCIIRKRAFRKYANLEKQTMTRVNGDNYPFKKKGYKWVIANSYWIELVREKPRNQANSSQEIININTFEYQNKY